MATRRNKLSCTKKEIKEGKGLAILSYLCVPFPLLFHNDNKFVKYHAKEGFNLFIIMIIYTIICVITKLFFQKEVMCSRNGFLYSCGRYEVPFMIIAILIVIGFILMMFIIIGVTNVIDGKCKHLPLIGKLNILKKLYGDI